MRIKLSHLRRHVREVLKEFIEPGMGMGGAVPKGEWVLLADGDPRRAAVQQELFDLIQLTYSSIGGHFKLTSPESLNRYNFWIVEDLDEDPEIDVALFGKPDIGGNKLGAAANDGSGAAANAYKQKSAELRSGGSVGGVGNWWGELSGKAAYAALSRGAPAIEDEAAARALLAGDSIVWHGEHPNPSAPDVFRSRKGWYTKKFGSKSSTKIILGNPK